MLRHDMGRKKQYAELGNFRIDLKKLLVTKLLIQANSGGGKSYTIRKLVEEAYGFCQIILIDPDGEFFTLREQFDFVLAAPKSKEAAATVKTAPLLAERLLELNTSAIIDIYELGTQKRTFVKKFLDAMTNAPRALWHPVIVIIDEAHMFAPEKDACESTEAVVNFMSLGRKRGFCGVMATQRIAKLSKDAGAEANNKLIGRCAIDVDQKRAGDELGISNKDDIRALRKLSAGKFHAFGPAISDEVIEVQIGKVKTTHIEAGQQYKYKAPAPSTRVKAVLGKLADLADESDEQARTVAEWQAKYRELENQLRVAKAAQPKEPKAIETVKTVEKMAIKDSQIKRLEKALALAGDVEQKLLKATAKITESAGPLQAALRATITLSKQPQMTISQPTIGQRVQQEFLRPPTSQIKAPRTIKQPPAIEDNGELPEGEALILRAAIQYNGVDKGALQTLTGYKTRTRNEYTRRLKLRGFIVENGSKVIATAEGRAALPSAEPLPTGQALRDMWLAKLPDGERSIFKLLVDAYPNAVAKTTIDESTGYAIRTRNEYLRRMSKRNLFIETNDGVQASETLF